MANEVVEPTEVYRRMDEFGARVKDASASRVFVVVEPQIEKVTGKDEKPAKFLVTPVVEATVRLGGVKARFVSSLEGRLIEEGVQMAEVQEWLHGTKEKPGGLFEEVRGKLGTACGCKVVEGWTGLQVVK